MTLATPTRWLATMFAAAGLFAVAAPSTAQAQEYYVDDEYDGYDDSGIQVVADTPNIVSIESVPPEPYVEDVPIAPAHGWIWVAGSWHWDGYQWVWVSGRWVAPRVGYVYIEPFYDVVGTSCLYTAGYFVPRRRVSYYRNYIRDYGYRHWRSHRGHYGKSYRRYYGHRYNGPRHGSHRYDGRRYSGRHDGRRHDGRRYSGRYDGRRHDGRRYERRHDGARRYYGGGNRGRYQETRRARSHDSNQVFIRNGGGRSNQWSGRGNQWNGGRGRSEFRGRSESRGRGEFRGRSESRGRSEFRGRSESRGRGGDFRGRSGRGGDSRGHGRRQR